MTDLATLLQSAPSPAEILRQELSLPFTGISVVVGPPTEDQSEAGAIAIIEMGPARFEANLEGFSWVRLEVRCLSRTLSTAEAIGWAVRDYLHQKGRRVVSQPSSGLDYLVHQSLVIGPTPRYVSQDAWESVLIVELAISLNPVT